jgi:hypothetical protein
MSAKMVSLVGDTNKAKEKRSIALRFLILYINPFDYQRRCS